MVSQKCRYALRAILELAKQFNAGSLKVAVIAKAQDIPPRFLEVILSELKQGGFVESRRGNEGGYLLLRSPRKLSVGEVMRFVEGPIGPVASGDGAAGNRYRSMWRSAEKALSDIYDGTTFQNLIEEEARVRGQEALSYAI
jgi:Rrf2 family protein